jgi:hypothetical protein
MAQSSGCTCSSGVIGAPCGCGVGPTICAPHIIGRLRTPITASAQPSLMPRPHPRAPALLAMRRDSAKYWAPMLMLWTNYYSFASYYAVEQPADKKLGGKVLFM